MSRVVITGIGLVTGLGIGVEATWQGLIDGTSAVGPIGGYDASSLHTQLAAEITDFDAQPFIKSRRTLRMMTRNDQLGQVGAVLAVNDSGLDLAAEDGERVGVFTGTNKEISDPMYLEDATLAARAVDGTIDMLRFGETAQSGVYPLFYVEGLQAASLFYISQAFGLKGANAFFAGAAEAGACAVGRAYRAIRRGEVDAAVAGGFDDPVWWWNMTRYDGLGLMTERNDLGSAACRPYERSRTGTVMGEGAAMFVLEQRERAMARGARVYAEIVGFGNGHDAFNPVTPHPDGRGLQVALRAALREADSNPSDIGYIAAHGSGTQLGDASEARAIRAVFGSAAERLAASSVKPATGHLMGGGGALNVAVGALALHHQVAPPTLNLENLDPVCELDWIPGHARALPAEQVIAVARGFEGQNIALALRAAN